MKHQRQSPKTLIKRFLAVAVACAAAAFGLAACSSGSNASGSSNELRLGYFPNITHALPLLGVSNGEYQKALGDTKLTTQTFNAGPSAVEAVLSGAIDASYIGPNPAINAYAKSNGSAVRIISGATSRGAQFIVNKDVTENNLKGKTFATPQLGNTQDVALRYWLKEKGLSAPAQGQGDVNILPTENAQSLELFKKGDIDGAWVPEPWASRLVIEGGGKVLVNEPDLWPNGEFVTTHLLVSTEYLENNPDKVKALLQGELAVLNQIESDPKASREAVNKALDDLTKPLPPQVLERAWDNLKVTLDPIASSLKTDQEHAVAVGIADDVDLKGIYDLRILNGLLKDAGKKPVSAGGLGQE
ncbi:MAG: ABC transporter substrate-binding protein [Candidatus Nanopelagicales bacterium]